MIAARKVGLRVNGMQASKATLHRGEKQLALVVSDPLIGEFVIDDSFALELLELAHPHELRRNLPNGGWMKVSLRILIALLGSGTVHVAEES